MGTTAESRVPYGQLQAIRNRGDDDADKDADYQRADRDMGATDQDQRHVIEMDAYRKAPSQAYR